VSDPGHAGYVGTNPDVTAIQIVLAAPVTTYSITASDPAKGQLNIVWQMKGELCGTPKVPWTQEGSVVKWSHSDQPPDLCSHKSTDHAVTITVIVTTASGPNRGEQVTCIVYGTETRYYDYSEIHRDPRPEFPVCGY
jgi:hypothetical protein